MTPDLTLAERALDALEQLEARALVWGLVDSALSSDEVRSALQGVLDSPLGQKLKADGGCTITTVLDLRSRLESLQMLFRVVDARGDAAGWRTRMAEGIRLLAQLRQLFPKHEQNGVVKWESAPTLVADYRFLRRPRRYPKRDLAVSLVQDEVGEAIGDDSLRQAVLHWLGQMPSDGGLARFQVDATIRLLQSLESRTCSGTLVSAGTGSGKTLSFYVPALSWLAHQKARNHQDDHVRVLAIYPRNELLKDQLAEIFAQCRTFDGWISRQGGRPLRVGVLYGETPQNASRAFARGGWDGDAHERTCPFFSCPRPGCGKDMVLLANEREQSPPRLVCKGCQHGIDTSTLAFTRDAIEADPPDVLVTSVEMLNRHLSNPELQHAFGVGPRARQAPDLMLLDEVHLFSGTYGAQVGYLLRRWWAASGRRSSFVGLSATISGGQSFFASLTGLSEAVVQEIKPRDEDIEAEGAEYMLALRGDPVSQSALLSTTIQSLMLGTRLLDTSGTFDRRTRPFFGWRSFAFTDQLDATNRLYKDLLDAEGRDIRGNENLRRHPLGGLARLRRSQEPPGRRFLAGQDWRILQSIGHALTDRLKIGRTTAYDSGVSLASEVVVATAALEVGFDDPAVGLVLQHKAPRDMASFLQRKGRAGRTRHMRPWTVVVLSDYGRDRLAYQAYDQLFDPELPPSQLPLSNRYVQRMQAVFALIDELGERTFGDHPGGTVWNDLSYPPPDRPEGWTDDDMTGIRQLAANARLPLTQASWKSLKGQAVKCAPRRLSNDDRKWGGANWLQVRLRQQRLVALLVAFQEDPLAAEVLTARLADKLGLTTEETNVVMWSQPRPVLLGVIPTALRRLASGWRSGDTPGGDLVAGHPLPDYIPGNLFSDLSLPELRLDLPAPDEAPVYLPVQQGLSEFAPGKVSRRFDAPLWLGFTDADLSDFWQSNAQIVDRASEIDGWYQADRVGAFHGKNGTKAQRYLSFRPVAARLQQVSERRAAGLPLVSDTSNAQLEWISCLLAPRGGKVFHPAPHVGISRLISRLVAHTHAGQSAALVRRYAVASRAEMRLSSGNASRRITVQCAFQHDAQPAGVGFEMDTDAICVALRLPEPLHQEIDWSESRRLRAARAARFKFETIRHDALCRAVPNVFMRGWVAQIFQIAAILVATDQKMSLEAAIDRLAAGDFQPVLTGVLQTVFQMPEIPDDDEAPDRLRQELTAALATDEVRRALGSVAHVLVDPLDATWEPCLSLIVRATVGAAFVEAVQQACPQIDTDSLIVDIDAGLRDDGTWPATHEIWISETNPGGNGLVEQIVELLATQPDALYRHVEAALGARDFEWTDQQLRQVAQWIGGPQPVQEVTDAVAAVRRATSTEAAQSAFGALRAELVRRGQSVFHGYAVALSIRMLRPDTPQEIDTLVTEVLERWDALERELGIEIDVRVVCALSSEADRLDEAFRKMGYAPAQHNTRSWRFGVLMGILWAKGHALRATALPLVNRFVSLSIDTERLLLEQWLTPQAETIDPKQAGWAELARERLASTSEAAIRVRAAEAEEFLPLVTRTLIVEPVQFDYLNVYARLAAVRRRDDMIEWTFRIPDSA
ncbi:MAG: protein DpdJ [Burkholderiaceae bacterium]|nr:protein DpdJ [Burkholderiaceae bacterium]